MYNSIWSSIDTLDNIVVCETASVLAPEVSTEKLANGAGMWPLGISKNIGGERRKTTISCNAMHMFACRHHSYTSNTHPKSDPAAVDNLSTQHFNLSTFSCPPLLDHPSSASVFMILLEVTHALCAAAVPAVPFVGSISSLG